MNELIKRLKVVLTTLEDVGSITIPSKVLPELKSIIRDMEDKMAEHGETTWLYQILFVRSVYQSGRE